MFGVAFWIYNVVYNILFVYCYWWFQIAVIQEVIISSPIVAELHILFYFKHKTSRGEWHPTLEFIQM